MPESVDDWPVNAARYDRTLGAFAYQPYAVVWEQDNGGHPLPVRVEFEHLEPAVVPVLAEHRQANEIVLLAVEHDAQPACNGLVINSFLKSRSSATFDTPQPRPSRRDSTLCIRNQSDPDGKCCSRSRCR